MAGRGHLGETFDTNLAIERRRELATARMVPLAARVGGRIVQQEDRMVIEAEAARSRRRYSLVLVIHDTLAAGCGPTGGLWIRMSVANAFGRIYVHNATPDEDEPELYGPDENDARLSGTIYVRARDHAARVNMLAVAARMPPRFMSALEELFASEPDAGLDIDESGIESTLAHMSVDDEDWAYVLESLERLVEAIDRVAAAIEGAAVELGTPGQTTSCWNCRTQVVASTPQCPHCGAPI